MDVRLCMMHLETGVFGVECHYQASCAAVNGSTAEFCHF